MDNGKVLKKKKRCDHCGITKKYPGGKDKGSRYMVYVYNDQLICRDCAKAVRVI
jgi:hypothetical protein